MKIFVFKYEFDAGHGDVGVDHFSILGDRINDEIHELTRNSSETCQYLKPFYVGKLLELISEIDVDENFKLKATGDE